MRRSVSCHRRRRARLRASAARHRLARNFGTASTCAERSTREVEEMSATRPRGILFPRGGCD